MSLLDFRLWGRMESEAYKRKVGAADEPLARILDVAGCIKRRADQPSRTARDLRARVAKWTEVDGGILGTFILNSDLSLLCNYFII